MDSSTIRTEPQNARLSQYLAYLQSPEWRRRRDAAIRRSDWRCSRCKSKRELQVHHRTYERLGAEPNDDLEVLCSSCHQEHHHEEDKRTHLGVYIKLVSDMIATGRFENFADLSDAVKERCAKLKLPYNTGQVDRTLILLNSRIHFSDPKHQQAWPHAEHVADGPISHTEAVDICQRLGLKIPFRDIPAAKHITQRQADRVKAAAMVSQEILDSIKRCEDLEHATEEPPDEKGAA